MLFCAHTIFQPEEEGEDTHDTTIHCLQLTQARKLTDIEQAIDKHYNAIVLEINSDANFKQLPGPHPVGKMLNVCNQLSIAKLGQTDVIILDGRRIVVPKGAWTSIIHELHRAHSGMT